MTRSVEQVSKKAMIAVADNKRLPYIGAMVRLKEPATQETTQWREIRRTHKMLTEVGEWGAFTTGCQFAEKPLPIAVRAETIEHVKMLLNAELLRLGATP